MSASDAADLGFTLLPADDDTVTPEADLAAAADAALAGLTPAAPDDLEPIGMSWVFDFQAGRFIRQGGAPAIATGDDALIQWCYMAIYSARYAHAVFSDNFGREDPDEPIGELHVGEMISDYERRLREALLVHDRVSDVIDFVIGWDPTEGVLTIEDFSVVKDEDESLMIPGIRVNIGDVT